MVTAFGKQFVTASDMAWESVGQGVRRKIMTCDDNLMMVVVAFDTGGIGSLHQHVHTQMSYVESGVFAITIAGRKTGAAGRRCLLRAAQRLARCRVCGGWYAG